MRQEAERRIFRFLCISPWAIILSGLPGSPLAVSTGHGRRCLSGQL